MRIRVKNKIRIRIKSFVGFLLDFFQKGLDLQYWLGHRSSFIRFLGDRAYRYAYLGYSDRFLMKKAVLRQLLFLVSGGTS
jgi:hypothetical protein